MWSGFQIKWSPCIFDIKLLVRGRGDLCGLVGFACFWQSRSRMKVSKRLRLRVNLKFFAVATTLSIWHPKRACVHRCSSATPILGFWFDSLPCTAAILRLFIGTCNALFLGYFSALENPLRLMYKFISSFMSHVCACVFKSGLLVDIYARIALCGKCLLLRREFNWPINAHNILNRTSCNTSHESNGFLIDIARP